MSAQGETRATSLVEAIRPFVAEIRHVVETRPGYNNNVGCRLRVTLGDARRLMEAVKAEAGRDTR